MEVMEISDRPASQDFFSVAGRLLFIETNSLELRKRLEQLFSGWQLTSVSSLKKSPDAHISFRCAASTPEIPDQLNNFEIAEGGKCYTDGADFYLALGASLVHLENGTPVNVNVWFAELPTVRDSFAARVASFSVCAALRRYGLFDLHSAGVVEPDSEKGVLIIGASGSGKSTLVLQLAQSGWSYLSDDVVLLSMVDGAVEARGFRSFFAVSTGANDLFKHCFEPDAVFGSQRREKTMPGLLIFTSVSGAQKSRLNKLTQAETMMRLLRACPWATYETSVAAANLQLLSALARQARGFDLSAGYDLLETDHAALLLRSLV